MCRQLMPLTINTGKARINIISISSLQEWENQACPNETTRTYSNVLFHKPYRTKKGALPSNPFCRGPVGYSLTIWKKKHYLQFQRGDTDWTLVPGFPEIKPYGCTVSLRTFCVLIMQMMQIIQRIYPGAGICNKLLQSSGLGSATESAQL